jgi:hypothetical protein
MHAIVHGSMDACAHVCSIQSQTSRATIDGSDIVTWLSSMESMKQYARKPFFHRKSSSSQVPSQLGGRHSNIFDDAGWTGERVLQLYDEAPLIELGMHTHGHTHTRTHTRVRTPAHTHTKTHTGRHLMPSYPSNTWIVVQACSANVIASTSSCS